MPTSQFESRFAQQSPIESANAEAMCASIRINHVHSSLSYQQATYHKHIAVVMNCLVAMALTGLYPHTFLCGSALESELESADSSTESANSSPDRTVAFILPALFFLSFYFYWLQMALYPNSLGLLIGYFIWDKLIMNEANPRCWKTPTKFNMLDHLMLHICSPMSNRKYNTVDMWKARWRQTLRERFILMWHCMLRIRHTCVIIWPLQQVEILTTLITPFDDQIAESLMVLCLEITS